MALPTHFRRYSDKFFRGSRAPSPSPGNSRPPETPMRPHAKIVPTNYAAAPFRVYCMPRGPRSRG